MTEDKPEHKYEIGEDIDLDAEEVYTKGGERLAEARAQEMAEDAVAKVRAAQQPHGLLNAWDETWVQVPREVWIELPRDLGWVYQATEHTQIVRVTGDDHFRFPCAFEYAKTNPMEVQER